MAGPPPICPVFALTVQERTCRFLNAYTVAEHGKRLPKYVTYGTQNNEREFRI